MLEEVGRGDPGRPNAMDKCHSTRELKILLLNSKQDFHPLSKDKVTCYQCWGFPTLQRHPALLTLLHCLSAQGMKILLGFQLPLISGCWLKELPTKRFSSIQAGTKDFSSVKIGTELKTISREFFQPHK